MESSIKKRIGDSRAADSKVGFACLPAHYDSSDAEIQDNIVRKNRSPSKAQNRSVVQDIYCAIWFDCKAPTKSW